MVVDFVYSNQERRIVEYLRENPNADLTYLDVANATEIQPRCVNLIITTLTKKGLVKREVVGEAKFIRLTLLGKTANLNEVKTDE